MLQKQELSDLQTERLKKLEALKSGQHKIWYAEVVTSYGHKLFLV